MLPAAFLLANLKLCGEGKPVYLMKRGMTNCAQIKDISLRSQVIQGISILTSFIRTKQFSELSVPQNSEHGRHLEIAKERSLGLDKLLVEEEDISKRITALNCCVFLVPSLVISCLRKRQKR